MTTKKKTREPVEIKPEHKEQLIKIGERVRELREDLTDDSYEVFAIKNGINRISQYRLEKGENFQMNTLLKVISGLGISTSKFFETM